MYITALATMEELQIVETPTFKHQGYYLTHTVTHYNQLVTLLNSFITFMEANKLYAVSHDDLFAVAFQGE